MKYIQLGLELSDDLVLKKIVYLHNDTGLENNTYLLKRISLCILESLYLNKEDLELQELLEKLGITKADKES